MAGAQFISLFHATTSRSSLLKPITSRRSPFYNPIKNYGQAINGNRGRRIEERAPSTAEEFQRVAEEKKAKEAQQGLPTKTTVAAENPTVADTNRFTKEG
ncbi:hypothetical protein Lal_00048721 [Lupinus albus]|uniref:Uncharacterized protein n=1 Tax=Lupinus albus TaxID=3870 RepID=A0A6A5LRS4_LUPAL|nr:hypothetical protein Lalb_Chr17g0348671 [Lupinus albus]KAF1864156.1 hypothetical protein Lal_00048721 [Lupinus albus]